MKLVNVADRQCVSCHADLQTTHGSSDTFANQIKRFSDEYRLGGHPWFALEYQMSDGFPFHEPAPGVRHSVHSLIAKFQRAGEPDAKMQDQAQIAIAFEVNFGCVTDSCETSQAGQND